jgi:divalent metal cation (Fe/Co/Zn/Cd) transporter
MEKFVLISQAVSLSVIVYVVTYFLITWHWPETLLSIFVSTCFLYLLCRRSMQALSYTVWL